MQGKTKGKAIPQKIKGQIRKEAPAGPTQKQPGFQAPGMKPPMRPPGMRYPGSGKYNF